MVVGLVEDRIRHKLAFLEPSAGQPFDLHEELRAERLQHLLGNGLIALGDQGAEHPIAPDLRPGVVLQKIGLAGVMKPVEQFLVAGGVLHGEAQIAQPVLQPR